MARLIWLAILAAILEALTGCAAIATTLDQRQVTSSEQLGVLVEAAPALTIIVPNGSVRLHAGEAGRVAAVATRRGYGRTSADAQAALDGLEVAFSQQGAQVTLEARRLRPLGQGQGDEAELDVTVPAGASVVLRVDNGEVVAAATGGDLTAEVLNGMITLTPAKGDAFSFTGEVANGSIQSAHPEIRSATGQGLEASGSVGDGPGYTIRASVANGIIALNRAP